VSAVTILELTDNHGDRLTVHANPDDSFLSARTPRGMVVYLDHAAVRELRTFLRLNMPAPADEAV
jgi:hypothetical protein